MRAFLGWGVLVVALGAGCFSSGTRFKSSRASELRGPFGKLFVFADIGHRDGASPLELARELERLGQRCSVTFVIGHGAEPQRAELMQQVDAAGDHHLLTINARGGTIVDGYVAEAVYEFALLDLRKQQTLWSAMASVKVADARGQALAAGAFHQLASDGVIPPSCAHGLRRDGQQDKAQYP